MATRKEIKPIEEKPAGQPIKPDTEPRKVTQMKPELKKDIDDMKVEMKKLLVLSGPQAKTGATIRDILATAQMGAKKSLEILERMEKQNS